MAFGGLNKTGKPAYGGVLFAEYMTAPHHLEASLESALMLAELGVPVTWVHLHRILPQTEFGFGRTERLERAFELLGSGPLVPTGGPVSKGVRKASAYAKRRKLNASFWVARNLPSSQVEQDDVPPESLAELKAWTVNGLKVGRGIASSLISASRNPLAVPTNFPRMVSRLTEASLTAARWLEEYLETACPEYVAVFNGRFAVPNALLEVARNSGLRTLFHERGMNVAGTAFYLAETSPHDLKALGSQLQAWRSLERAFLPTLAGTIGNSFFEKQRASFPWGSGALDNDVDSQLIPGTPAPIPGQSLISPETWVYFSSSEDEYESVVDGGESVFQSQLSAVGFLAGLAGRFGARLIVRVHPRVSTLAAAEQDRWSRRSFIPLESDCALEIVESDSNISSYSLIEKADKVIVWHSSIGVEALKMGKPVLSLRNSNLVRAGLGLEYGSSLDRVQNFLRLPAEAPKSQAAVNSYGFALKSIGFRWRHYNPEGPWVGKFMGKNLHNPSRFFAWVLRGFQRLFLLGIPHGLDGRAWLEIR